jgi:hypothetical protein
MKTFEDYVLAAMPLAERCDVVTLAKATAERACEELGHEMNGTTRCVRCLHDPALVEPPF